MNGGQFLTACITIIVGITIFVGQDVVKRFVLDPISEQIEIKSRIYVGFVEVLQPFSETIYMYGNYGEYYPVLIAFRKAVSKDLSKLLLSYSKFIFFYPFLVEHNLVVSLSNISDAFPLFSDIANMLARGSDWNEHGYDQELNLAMNKFWNLLGMGNISFSFKHWQPPK